MHENIRRWLETWLPTTESSSSPFGSEFVIASVRDAFQISYLEAASAFNYLVCVSREVVIDPATAMNCRLNRPYISQPALDSLAFLFPL